MGNHTAGAAVVATATALIDVREKTGQTAIEILDIACEPYRKRTDQRFGCDIEFDDACYPGHPFGDLLGEAFDPDGAYDPNADADGEGWYRTVIEPFRERYGFC